MSDLIPNRIEQARRGENPTVIAKMKSGWAVIGDVQPLRGYCLLLADPIVKDLNTLSKTNRLDFLSDMGVLGDAILEVSGAYRINYEILGNTDPFLHAHVFPRFMNEMDERRRRPVWDYYHGELPKFDPVRDRPLMESIRSSLKRRGAIA